MYMRKILSIAFLTLAALAWFRAESQNRPEPGATLESLQVLLGLFAESSKNSGNLQTLIARLESLNYEPVVVTDQNSDTGSLTFVRTNRPPLGTRYFHAQYFEEHRPQHLSVEFQSGSNALELVAGEISRVFPAASLVEESNHFRKWRLDDDYLIWIKRLQAEDLPTVQESPFNAYGAEDIGAIQITLEESIGHD